MITALLLAAGQGSRMQYKAKALLSLGSKTFVQHALQQLHAAGLEELILITGSQHEAVWNAALQADVPVREVYNADFESGLLSSIQAGIRAVSPATTAVLITLVDLPFLAANDYRAACLAWQEGNPGNLLRSQSEGKPGHPVIIPSAYFTEILQQPASDKGCSFLFQRYPERVQFHAMARGRIDIDTMEDYHAHITS
jgi:CTP:molybdopterin cytidylyltransferase MocA